ncbi:hypothetical protein IC575_026873 [Cucumis melo]
MEQILFKYFAKTQLNMLEVRDDLVLALEEKIKAIPDGKTSGAKHSGGWGSSSSFNNIKFDSSSDGNFESEYFQQSEESSQFRNEYEMRKMKQDQGLDVISEGLDMLKNLAHDMNEELDRQVPLIEEIDSKVDKVTDEIKNTNVRLKETLYEVRTSQNFCIDIILLCVILGIASYLYKLFFHWLKYGMIVNMEKELSTSILWTLMIFSALCIISFHGFIVKFISPFFILLY